MPNRVDRKDLIRRDDGPTVAPCPTCGVETFHVRIGYDDPDGYTCLHCACAAIPGHIPVHQADSGMTFKINPGNGIGVMMIHYSADPDKNPDTERGRIWLKNERREFHNRPQEWARRYEIDFSGASGPRCFPEFDDTLSYQPDLKFVKGKPLLASWDFGTRNPATSFLQWDEENNLRVLLTIVGDNPHIEFFAQWVNRLMKIHFFEALGVKDAAPDASTLHRLYDDRKLMAYGDSAGHQKGRDLVSDIQFLKKYGWRIQGVNNREPSAMITKLRSLTIPGETGLPRLYVNGKGFWIRGSDPLPVPMEPRENGSLLCGLSGGYHWRQNAKGVVMQPEKPEKDLNSHIMDTVLYAVDRTYSLEDGPRIEPLEHSDSHASDWFSQASLALPPERSRDVLDFFYNPMRGLEPEGARP